MAQRARAGDRQPIAEPGKDLGGGKVLRELALGIAIEPVESRPVRIGVEEGRQRREVGLRVASAEIQPSDDLVGEGMRALLRRLDEHTSELQSLMCISYAVFC